MYDAAQSVQEEPILSNVAGAMTGVMRQQDISAACHEWSVCTLAHVVIRKRLEDIAVFDVIAPASR